MWSLAVTGGLGFLGVAGLAYAHARSALFWTSGVLAATSALWHGTQYPPVFWADQAAMVAFVGVAGYECASRGVIPAGIGAASCLYGVVIYHLGRRWKCWAFHPTEEPWYHATLHILPLIDLATVFTFFPNNNEAVPDLFLLPEVDCPASACPCLPEG